jgi:spore germination protein (amino acid permease)
MAETAGTGAWLTLLLGAVFFAVDAFIIAYLGYAYRGKTLFEYARLLAGKTMACLIAIIYMMYFFVLLTFIIRFSADIIKDEILFKTPVWATMLLLLTISLYGASKGLTNIGRIIEYLGLIILIIGFVLHFMCFSQGNILNIMPMFDPSVKNLYFEALPGTIFCFLGFEIITIIPFSKRNSSTVLWTAIISIFVLCIFFIMIVESCYAILSVEDIINYTHPLIVAIRRLDIAILQFAKRLDLFFIMIWLAAIFCSVSIISFTTAEYTKKLVPKLKGNRILIAIGTLAFIAGLLLPNAEEVSKLFIRFVTYFGLIPAFAIPLILLIIHIFRPKNDVKKDRKLKI